MSLCRRTLCIEGLRRQQPHELSFASAHNGLPVIIMHGTRATLIANRNRNARCHWTVYFMSWMGQDGTCRSPVPILWSHFGPLPHQHNRVCTFKSPPRQAHVIPPPVWLREFCIWRPCGNYEWCSYMDTATEGIRRVGLSQWALRSNLFVHLAICSFWDLKAHASSSHARRARA